MSAYRIAQRYAKSLIDLADDRGKTADVTADVRMLSETLRASRELRHLLQSPIVKTDAKGKVLDAVFQGRVEDETMAFIKILVQKRREAYLVDITRAFIEQYNALKDITPATLTTASKADAAFKTEVIGLLKQKFGKTNIELRSKVEESLIGGFVLQFDDKLYDSSVSSQLNEIRKELQSTTMKN